MATRDDIIKHRLAQIRHVVRQNIFSSAFKACVRKDTTAVMEGVIFIRQMTFPKLGIFNDGAALIDHWPIIHRELHEPWGVHFAESNEAAWIHVGRQMESAFFSTLKSGFDEATLGLWGNNGWVPVTHSEIPGFATVSNRQAFDFLGLIGGQHPEVDHPRIPIELSAKRLSVAPGEILDFPVAVTGTFEFPLTFSDVTANPRGWATISPEGTIRLAPAANLPPQTAIMEVKAVDGLEEAATLNVVIDVVAGELKVAPMTTVIRDHKGKISQGRVSALLGLLIAGYLAINGSDVGFDVLALFVLGPSGLTLWQKIGAPQEASTE